jgi:hypothetical protein
MSKVVKLSKTFLEELEQSYKAMEKVANLALNRFAHRMICQRDLSRIEGAAVAFMPVDLAFRKYLVLIGCEPLELTSHWLDLRNSVDQLT